MRIINRTYRKSKKSIKSLVILLFIIIFPLIFNSLLFDYRKIGNNNTENRFEEDSKKNNPYYSLSHPISADDFKFYKYITIDHTKVSGTGNLIDFPVLISIFDSDLHDNTQFDGDDIAFSNNFQWLDYEIELYNKTYNSTHAHLVAWVRIPVLSTSEDTIIRMYFGNPFIDSRENPTGVWDSNFKMVHHLEETIGSTSYDSTSNSKDGSVHGNPTLGVTGNIGNCYQFDDSPENQRVRLSSLGALQAFTMEIWAYPTAGEKEAIWGKDFQIDTMVEGTGITYSTYNPKFFGAVIPNGPSGPGSSRVDISAESETSENIWNHLVVTYDGSTLRMYVNGYEVSDSPKTGMSSPNYLFDSNHYFAYGGYNWENEEMWFDGKLDEARLSNIARTSDWILTEYNNQDDPNSFYSVGNTKKVYVPKIFDFKYFKEIIFDHTKISGTSNLINFPVLISIFDADLHNETQLDGDDIAFNNGTSWLFHEIEVFNKNYNTTHAQLIVWVCVPCLSPFEDTVIRMYYGNITMGPQENPQGVWNSNYVGVWHLGENSGSALDSTLFITNGTPIGGVNQGASGQIGYAYDFDGINGRVNFGDPPDGHLDHGTTSFTYSIWVKIDQTTGTYQIPFYKGGSSAFSRGYDFETYSDGSYINSWISDGSTYKNSDPTIVTFGNWMYLVAVIDRSSDLQRLYRDGSSVGSPTDLSSFGSVDTTLEFQLSRFSYPVDGIIDEVRISSGAHSPSWIATEYANQKDPNNFYIVSNQIEVSKDSPSDASYFHYYKVIQIDHTFVLGLGYHSNFPLLLSFFDSDLHSDVQVDGDDIAFALGSKWLDHEIELFNQNYNGTHAQLVVWVRIPELSTSLDTYIRMYYGNSTMNSRQNPTGVWDGSYKGVWHLSEPSGFTQDSTFYGENGMVSGTVIRSSTGQIGNAYNYGPDGTFNVGDPADGHLDFGTKSFMASMWINIDTSTGTWQTPLYKGASSTWDPGYLFETPTTGDRIGFHITDGINNVGSPYASMMFDTWTYIVGIVDRTDNLIRIYKNGNEVETGTDISTILSIDGDIEFQCANPPYDLDGLLDEIRILNVTRSSNWIKTEYYNQYDPSSFYSIGEEQTSMGIIYSNLQINTIDLYGNAVSYANVSIYNHTKLIQSSLTKSNGTASIINLIQAEYNFTVSITSDIGNHVEIVNITSKAIMINQSFQIINLICNVGSNFFEVIDIDGVYLDTGWIIVADSFQELRNCSIDNNGHARFCWVNTTPYEYNYTVYYQDNKYNPNVIKVASGDVNTPNSLIQVQASLTTIDFTVQTLITKQPVSGVKCILTATNTGESIVNLTSDNDGKAKLRWLNSTGINGNYSLQLEFFGALRRFNMTSITVTLVTEANFTVSAKDEYNIYIEVSLENYKTELISFNPTEYISLEWGTQLRLRILFNVSKAIGAEQLLGPTYSDIMTYEILKGADLIQSGTMGIESGYIGTHYSFIDTKELESDVTYLVFISAQKAGYSIPQDLLLQLNILKNNLILNQSENDDLIPTVYWLDNIDLSLKAYGEISEGFTTETTIFQNIDHNFKFFLPNINTNWNLTQITFNIYNISWNVNVSDIYLSIVDPYGTNRIFNTSNHAGWDYNLGIWTGITIDLNKESPTGNNDFEFDISGTFDGTIDVIADISFMRNNINIQYLQYNISDSISILSASEGWAMKNVSFLIQNCYFSSNWSKVDLTLLTNLNITTGDGFRYSLQSGDNNGNGELIIDDRILYPQGNEFLFFIESNSDIIFDAIIVVEYIQGFYQNQYLETLNISYVEKNIPNGGNFQLDLTNEDWKESYTELLLDGINNGIEYFNPSQLAMNITIGSQTYTIKNTFIGQGSFSLNTFDKDTLYNAVIETNQPVNFTISLKVSYLRTAAFETLGSVSYVIRESPDIYGMVEYYSDLAYYLQTIDTSLIDAGYYTIRFEINNENYNMAIKDLDLIVMKRSTLVNGESTIAKLIEFMYVKDSVNFTFLYTDALSGVRITELKTQDYMWEKYDIDGNVTANGEGTLIQTFDDSLVLDFNSEIRTVGDYLLIVTFEKDNYEYRNAIIHLTINKRELDYSLGEVFENYQTNIVQGKIVQIKINLTDPTRGGIPLLNGTVLLTIKGSDYEFSEFADGTYMLNFSTKSVNAFFSSKTLRGIINITREDYFSEEFFITIVVEMEEIFPGMPTFYFLILFFGVLSLVGSIIGYRIYKHATIPTFVKNVRAIKKEIKSGKEISESLLYSPKDVFIGERVRDKWSSIGLSLGEILGVEIKKSKKLYKPMQIRPEKVHDLKPLGLFLMKWDERIGTELLMKHPSNLNITDKTLMQIYSTHEYSGEKGAITLTDGSKNILSYYTGPESGYYIILFLKLEDDPDLYEGALANVAQIILQNLEDDIYLQMMPSLFQRLSVYPSLNSEQILIYYLEDEIKRMIINFLRDYGVITKSELVIWVKDKQIGEVIDLEAIIADLIKSEIIKVASVKGIPSELIFLTKDIFMLRVPPDKIFKHPETYGLPAQFTKMYQEEVKKFFSDYYPTEEDNIKLLEVLVDPEVYQTLCLLRTTITTMKDFDKLKNKGVSDIYSVLKKLYDTQMIEVFKDENEIEYYTLLTDFHIDSIFPKYLVNAIKVMNEQKSKSDKVLIQYLNILEETYYNSKSEK